MYLDIDLPHMPCELLDLRFLAQKDRQHSISRFHLEKDGVVEMTRHRTYEEVLEAVKYRVGCKIKGSFYKHFVSNTFSIALGNSMYLTQLMFDEQDLEFDFSHNINSLMLGDTSSHRYYEV